MFLKILCYLAAFSLIACVILVLRKHAHLRAADRFGGSVVNLVPRRGSKGGTVYALEVTYRDGGGTEQRFVTGMASQPAARQVGEKVVVLAHRDGSKPDLAIFQMLYLGYWIWFCVGIGAIGCLLGPTLVEALYAQRQF
jgi:hypothetical protein